MTSPEIQNDPYFMGNLGHFEKFHPPFSQEIGEIDPPNPPIFTNLRIVSCRIPISWTTGLKIHPF